MRWATRLRSPPTAPRRTTRVNSQNQLTVNGSETNLAYDKDGNTTTDENGDTDVYNAWNGLVAIKNSGGTTLVSYTYNADGQHITQTASSTTTDFYLTTQDQIIEERQSSICHCTRTSGASILSTTFCSAMTTRPAAASASAIPVLANASMASITSHSACNRMATDSSGGVAQRFIYTPKGQLTVLSSAWTTASEAYNWSYYFQGMRLVPEGKGNLYLSETRIWIRQRGRGRVRIRMVMWMVLIPINLPSSAPIRLCHPSGTQFIDDRRISGEASLVGRRKRKGIGAMSEGDQPGRVGSENIPRYKDGVLTGWAGLRLCRKGNRVRTD